MIETKKLYYSIKEVSELLHVPYATLRYWEQEVKQLQPKTNSGGTRFYRDEDIAIVKKIIYLREQNVPVRELSKRLAMDDKVLDKRAKAMENLQEIKRQLQEIRSMI